MLGKLINGELITPSEYEKRKIVIANPTDEILKAIMGYKDLIVEEQPEYNPTTHSLKPVYTETQTAITKSWEVLAIPEVEEDGN